MHSEVLCVGNGKKEYEKKEEPARFLPRPQNKPNEQYQCQRPNYHELQSIFPYSFLVTSSSYNFSLKIDEKSKACSLKKDRHRERGKYWRSS